MKFCRIVERGNRQVLLTVDPYFEEGEDEQAGYCICMETHYRGDDFATVTIHGFATQEAAALAMMESDDDEIIQGMTEVLEEL